MIMSELAKVNETRIKCKKQDHAWLSETITYDNKQIIRETKGYNCTCVKTQVYFLDGVYIVRGNMR